MPAKPDLQSHTRVGSALHVPPFAQWPVAPEQLPDYHMTLAFQLKHKPIQQQSYEDEDESRKTNCVGLWRHK